MTTRNINTTTIKHRTETNKRQEHTTHIYLHTYLTTGSTNNRHNTTNEEHINKQHTYNSTQTTNNKHSNTTQHSIQATLTQ